MTEEVMACPEPESQLLPFLAAGTLSAAERRSVLSHVGGCERCREDLRETEKLIAGLRALHLTPDEVVAAAASGSRPTHLDLCPACQAEVTTVQRSHAQLTGSAAAAAPPKPWWRPLAKGLASARAGYATAATLLLASAILNGRIGTLKEDNRRLDVQLRQSQASGASAPSHAAPVSAPADDVRSLQEQIRVLSRPQVNVPLVNLEPPAASRSQSSGVQTIAFAPGVATAALVLHLGEDRPETRFELEILDERGRSVWQGSGLQKSAFNTFTLGLTRGFLPAGAYRLRLYGLQRGRRDLIETYAVRVREP